MAVCCCKQLWTHERSPLEPVQKYAGCDTRRSGNWECAAGASHGGIWIHPENSKVFAQKIPRDYGWPMRAHHTWREMCLVLVSNLLFCSIDFGNLRNSESAHWVRNPLTSIGAHPIWYKSFGASAYTFAEKQTWQKSDANSSMHIRRICSSKAYK